MTDLDHLAELERGATVGPWHVDDDWFVVSVPHEIDDESGMETFDPAIAIAARGHNYADAAFIAALRNAAPSLIAEAREAARLRTALEHIRDCPPTDAAVLVEHLQAEARAALVKP